MSKLQTEEIKNLLKNDESQNILKKILKDERLVKLSNTYKILQDNNLSKNIISNNNIYYSTKRNYPNISVNASNILNTIHSNNKSLYSMNTVDRLSSSHLNKLNNTLIALKNYGSTKDILPRKNKYTHLKLISSLPDTPSLNHYNNTIETLPKTQNYNNIGKKEINESKKSTTILYKRKADTEKNNFTDIYYSLNKNNKDFNTIKNYKINSITYRISKKKIRILNQKIYQII